MHGVGVRFALDGAQQLVAEFERQDRLVDTGQVPQLGHLAHRKRLRDRGQQDYRQVRGLRMTADTAREPQLVTLGDRGVNNDQAERITPRCGGTQPVYAVIRAKNRVALDAPFVEQHADAARRRRVLVNAEHPFDPALSPARQVCRMRRLDAFDRHFDRDHRPAFLAGVYVDAAPHVVDQALADRQPEAAPVILRGLRTLAAGKCRKQLAARLLVDALAGIRYRDAETNLVIRFVQRAEFDHDFARVRELDCVIDDIDEYLFDSPPVRDNAQVDVMTDHANQFEVFRVGGIAHDLQHAFEQVDDIELALDEP